MHDGLRFDVVVWDYTLFMCVYGLSPKQWAMMNMRDEISRVTIPMEMSGKHMLLSTLVQTSNCNIIFLGFVYMNLFVGIRMMT